MAVATIVPLRRYFARGYSGHTQAPAGHFSHAAFAAFPHFPHFPHKQPAANSATTNIPANNAFFIVPLFLFTLRCVTTYTSDTSIDHACLSQARISGLGLDVGEIITSSMSRP